MRWTQWLFLCVALLWALTGIPALAQADLAGEWRVEFSTPMGPQNFNMYVTQQGPRLSGRLSNPGGEFPMRGTITGDEFTITWQHPVEGKVTDIVFKGRVKEDSLSGTAKVGDMPEGDLHADRTSR